MSIQRYTVTQYPVKTLLNWVESGEIAIPEIQRPFVWDATRVRDLLDSLHRGYPIGYLITWRSPNVRLKDGTLSAGKRILIDGQQRITALMAALLGREVLNDEYETVRIRIAFHPIEERFEVSNPAISKDTQWIDDISKLFDPHVSLYELVNTYAQKNPSVSQDQVFRSLERLRMIQTNPVGVIELVEDLDIETVTEIFIRVNSSGMKLSQADFAMSKIASTEKYDGHRLRKAIDYFCHLAAVPDFAGKIEKNDADFVKSPYWPVMQWLRDVRDDLYDPTYTDVLRVAFSYKFSRGRLQDLVALLSGRNFATKQYEEAIAEESFCKLKEGVITFMKETNFKRLVMILRSAGFITNDLIASHNAVNFAYIIFLRAREEGIPSDETEHLVRRWYAMSILTDRYTGSPDAAFDRDISQIERLGIHAHAENTISTELSEDFWTKLLPQLLETTSTQSPYFLAYLAAQVKLNDRAFLSKDMTVQDLLLNRGDKHHIYPKKYLQKQGLGRSRYNQVANLAMMQSEINIAIRDEEPKVYFDRLVRQVRGGMKLYGGITDEETLRKNFEENCIPVELIDGEVPDYDSFLAMRRKLMALRMKKWFETL